MRLPGHLHLQCVHGSMRAAQQRTQVGTAEGKIHCLFRKADDANALAVGREHPDSARHAGHQIELPQGGGSLSYSLDTGEDNTVTIDNTSQGASTAEAQFQITLGIT